MHGSERPSPRVSGLPGRFGALETAAATAFLFTLGFGLRSGEWDAMVNPDLYHLWSVRIVRFMDAIEAGRTEATFQSHHPGVTLMWLVGVIWKSAGVLHAALSPYKIELSVWPIAICGSIMAAATYPLLLQLVGRHMRGGAFLSGVLLATEPILVAHSRNAHLDVLAVTFAWFACLMALIALRKDGFGWAIGAGVLLGLALASNFRRRGSHLGLRWSSFTNLRSIVAWPCVES
ncbi:MAG: glycosyltransferase family 39 protein [Polyangiaceae bacterium]